MATDAGRGRSQSRGGLGARRPFFLGFVGLTAGFFASLLGLTGGIIIAPALLLALRSWMIRASGLVLATTCLLSLMGVLAESITKGSSLHWPTGLVLSGGVLLGCWQGGRILRRLPLRLVFAPGLVLALAALPG